MILIPNTDKKFLQANRGDIVGNVWSTFGVDFQDNLGAIRLGQRMKIVTKSGDANAANLGVPTCFTAFGAHIACLAGTRVFKSDKLAPDMVFSEDSLGSAHTNYSVDTDDMCGFNNALVTYNGNDGKIYSLDTFSSGTWTQRATGLNNGTGLLLYYKKYNRLYIADQTNIHSLDTSWALSSTGQSYDLALNAHDDNGHISCYAAGSDRIWFGTKRGASGSSSNNGDPAAVCSVYEWDGISNQPTKKYDIPATGIMSITVDKEIPVVMDTNGVMRRFDGQGFSEIGRLPLRRNQSLLLASDQGYTQGFIHHRGLAITKDGTYLALINNRTLFDYSAANRLYETLPSGIWEFDGNGSASMKHPLTLMGMLSTSVTDHGQNRVSLIGSLAIIPLLSTSAYGISRIFAGAEVYTDATTTLDAVFLDAPSPTGQVTGPEGQKYGYLATTFQFPSIVNGVKGATDMWHSMFIRYRQLLDSSDKIIAKFRLTQSIPIEATITWTSTTTFTTTTDLTALVGYEVEGIQGTGSGKCSHILTVVNNAGTYTVTVDETYTGVTGTAKVRIQNWTKCGSVADQASEISGMPIQSPASRIQGKVCMQFTGDDEVQEIAIINSPNQPMI